MRMREERTTRGSTVPVRGAHGITVGVIGASRVGRLVLDLLRNLDADVLLYDPHVSVAEAAALGARPADLDTLAAESDVVSVHAPDIPATYHQIDRRFLGLMRDGAVLINTARGRLVDTEALTEHLVSGRLDAILDVTDPEPLPADSPLYTLPNVLLTPHLAGAQGSELHRLGASAVAELARFAAGVPFEHPVGADDWNRIA